MVLIEDITEQEAEREAAAAAAAAEAARAAAEEEQAAAAAAAAAAARADEETGSEDDEGAAAAAAAGSAGEAGAAQPAAAAEQQQEEAPPPREPTAEEQEQLGRAEAAKAEGNALFGRGKWEEALERYAAALSLAPQGVAAQQRSVYHCNRSACLLKLERWADAAQECSAALELDPTYSKALLRRSAAYEALDDLERALADAQKALELDAHNTAAAALVKRLSPIVEERREKLKDEMMGKLKELGNLVLGKFGMSVDNFKAEKDPATGAFSIKFQQ